MVKCGRCGVDVDDSFEICPNCGNSLTESQIETPKKSDGEDICSNCGAALKGDVTFCSQCGAKVEIEDDGRCEECGSEVPEIVLFCPTCGAKIKRKEPKPDRTCPNCGFKLDGETAFCPECGTNVVTGNKPETSKTGSGQGFVDKITLNSIIKPGIVALIVAIVLSSIGLLIGFSWVSFIIAIILSAGFFAGLIDNEANAVVFGFFVGLILGILENPLVEFWYGALAAGFYDWLFGGQIVLLIILGIVCAYVSNIYLKKDIQRIAGNFLSWL